MRDIDPTALPNNVYDLMQIADETATDKGFWDNKDVNERFPEAIALIHAELSEALEAHREENYYQEDNIFEELADVTIRIWDLAAKCDRFYGDVMDGHTYMQNLKNKMAYNSTREFKHGKRY